MNYDYATYTFHCACEYVLAAYMPVSPIQWTFTELLWNIGDRRSKWRLASPFLNGTICSNCDLMFVNSWFLEFVKFQKWSGQDDQFNRFNGITIRNFKKIIKFAITPPVGPQLFGQGLKRTTFGMIFEHKGHIHSHTCFTTLLALPAFLVWHQKWY